MTIVLTQDRTRARRLCAIVEHWAGRYADDLEEVLHGDKLRADESKLMNTFELYASGILERLASMRWPKSHELVFKTLYDNDLDVEPNDGERRRQLLVALMAAEVEFHGPLKLSQAQNKDLAEILVNLGEACLAEHLYLHAAEAFDRAADLYLLLRDGLARDSSLYWRNNARQKIESRPLHKGVQWISWVTCGYGYKPYRLLLWVGVQLAVFALVLLMVVSTQPPMASLHLALTNYLNPAGASDLTGAAKIVLLTESYVGVLSLNVFFALLVRRWFR